MTEVFAVTADTWTSGYGSEIVLFLITNDEVKANNKFTELEKEGYYPTITKTIIDENINEYLGGYYE